MECQFGEADYMSKLPAILLLKEPQVQWMVQFCLLCKPETTFSDKKHQIHPEEFSVKKKQQLGICGPGPRSVSASGSRFWDFQNSRVDFKARNQQDSGSVRAEQSAEDFVNKS